VRLGGRICSYFKIGHSNWFSLPMLITGFAIFIGACNQSPSSVTSVSVSCAPVSIDQGAVSRCEVLVRGVGSFNSGVHWNASEGTIDASGQYTAPSLPGTVTITATSIEDQISGQASLTVASVAIQISPSTASVEANQSAEFTASVTGASNTAVTWTVNGIAGGSSATGTISASGLYTAPSSVPSPATVTVTATSQADGTKAASAAVTVTPVPIVVTISPTAATVAGLTFQQFTASVTGSSNTAVAWTVNGIAGGNSAIGLISPTGLYIGPASVPSPATVTVTSSSQVDGTKSASAVVTVTSPLPPVSVSVTPGTTSVDTSGTQQFTASVSGASDAAVSWEVEGIAGGNSTVGTISRSGLYTAPSSLPTASSVMITATSEADATKSGSAVATFIPASVPLSIAITPTWASVGLLATQQFTASVTGTSDTAVVWTVNGVVGGYGPSGTISTTGLYTAPSVIPSPAAVTVTATSHADPTQSASATFTLAPLVSADSFGCAGDGVTDDSACIQSASTLAAGTTLELGTSKNYVITQGLQLPDNITLEGNGSTLTFQVDGETQDLMPGNNNILHNLTVVNNGTNPAGSGNYQAPILIGNFGHGVGVANVLIDGVTINSNRPQGDALMITGDSHNVFLHAIAIPDNAFISSAIELHWGGQPTTSSPQVTLPHDVYLDGLTVGGMRFTNTWGAVLDLVSTYNVVAKNIQAANVQRGVVVSPGDYADEYTVPYEKGNLGKNISVSNAVFNGANVTGIDIDNFSVWGLLLANVTITTTQGSAIATVNNPSMLHVGQVIEVGVVNTSTNQQYQIESIDGDQITLDVPAIESVENVTIYGDETIEPAVFNNIMVTGTNTPDNVAGLYLQGSGVTVRNSTFTNFSLNGIGFGDWANDNNVENCVVSGNGRSGIWEDRVGRAHRNRFANCNIFNNNQGGNTDRKAASGIFLSSDAALIEGNTIGVSGDSQVYGIAIDNTATKTILLDNAIVNAQDAAIENGYGSSIMYQMLTLSQGNTGPSGVPFTVSPGTPLLDSISAEGGIVFHYFSPPTSGTYTFQIGDKVVNTNTYFGTLGIADWFCTTSTSPCVWSPENIAP